MSNRVLIIAEAGVNHNGDVAIAKKMIETAATAGADIVKFQTFKPEKLASKYAQKALYQKANTSRDESQLDMLKKLELSEGMHDELLSYSEKCGIKFLSTPFDIDSLKYLISIGIDILKIPSGEITNFPYLRECGKSKLPVIMSTGMSNMEEICDAIDVLKVNGTTELTLLHCNTQYPTPYKYVNLNAMKTLELRTGCSIGYSDHTEGIEIPIAAVAMGAKVIEKHFTLDHNLPGPDHKASLEPDQLTEMVRSIRNVEKAFGDGCKVPTESEIPNIIVARKSIVAARNIIKGETFTEENLTTKRPGNGITPMKWEIILGKKASRNYAADELIDEC